MDQGPLVETQRDDGQFLLDRLVEAGIDVTAACWLKESESGQWFLYIATRLVSEEGGTKRAYQAVNVVFRQIPQPFALDPLEVKVVSPGNPIAAAVHELHRRYGERSGIPGGGGGGRFGDLSIDGAYVYPSIPAPVRK